MPSPAHRASWPMAIAAKALAAALVYAFFVVVPSLVKPHWTEIVDFFGGELGVFTEGLMAVHCAVLLTGNAMFVFLYYFQIPFFEQFKISPKPWNFSVKSKREDTKTLIKLSIGLTLFNNLIIAFPLSFLNYYSIKAMGGTADLDSFPSSLELLKSILFAMVVEDAAFYTSHRTLHSFKALYANVHKLHHRYYQSLSFAAEFAHPMEFLLGNSIPFALGLTLLGAHGYTWLAWTVWRIGETITGHSGYDFPWAPWALLPFAGSAADHDAHHAINTGNYASFFIWWDRIFGTAIPEDVLEKNVYSKEPAAIQAAKVKKGH